MTFGERIVVTVAELLAGFIAFAAWAWVAHSFGLSDAFAAGVGVIAGVCALGGFR
jgi:hypothetical protein